MKSVIGVLGGLGPQTTAEFYLRLVQLGTKIARPAVSIWSLPLNIQKESEYIAVGAHTRYYLPLLKRGVQSLVAAGSSFVVIPCNTVHEFHSKLAKAAGIPVVNLIEVVAQEVEAREWSQVLLLATSRTVHTRLYQDALSKRGLSVVIPDHEDQSRLDKLIQGLLGYQKRFEHQFFLENLAIKSGCSKILLGCTDLQLAFAKYKDCIDSMEELAKHTVTLI